MTKEKILEVTWDGVGNFEEGKAVMFEKSKDKFTMDDILRSEESRGLLF
jgi:hypothetical protein